MTLRTIDYAEDRNFREGETIYDVDGNSYTVRGPCAVLNLNDNIVNNLNEPGMRECFTRMKPSESINKQTNAEPNGYRTITFHDSDHKPSWKRFGKGTGKLTVSSHCKSKYLSVEAEEVDFENPDRPYSKTAMVSFSEACGRELYAMLKEIYEPATEA